MLDDLFKRPQRMVQQSVECMLDRMLKSFKRGLKRSKSGKFRFDLLLVKLNFDSTHSRQSLGGGGG